MDDKAFSELRKTFPWTHQQFVGPGGGIVRVIDNAGQEVPLFTMIAFINTMTAKLAAKSEATAG